MLWAWALCQGGHVGCRYAALAALRLRSLNHKRAGLLVAAHAAGRPLPGASEVQSALLRIPKTPTITKPVVVAWHWRQVIASSS